MLMLMLRLRLRLRLSQSAVLMMGMVGWVMGLMLSPMTWLIIRKVVMLVLRLITVDRG